MAFTISSDAQLVFFQKVFGQNHPVTVTAKTLVAAGVQFEVLMYTIKASIATKHLKLPQVSLTYGTNSLMKGTINPLFAHQNKQLIESWINEVALKMGMVVPPPTPVVSPYVEPTSTVTVTGPAKLMLTAIEPQKKLQIIKQVMGITDAGLLEAKNLVEDVSSGPVLIKEFANTALATTAATTLEALGATVNVVLMTTTTGGTSFSFAGPQGTTTATVPPPMAKPVEKVIKLREAQALGQKVHGTSTGSVYHCIGIAEHVKVAARISKGGSISIRAEWTDSPKEDLKKLEEAGLGMKPDYASMHFGAEGVPLHRVIGAFLVGTGINWKAAVMNGSQLVIGE